MRSGDKVGLVQIMQQIIDQFITQLHNEKNTSNNTEISYRRDLTKLFEYLKKTDSRQLVEITSEDLLSYITYLNQLGRAATTVSRTIASMKAFFSYTTNFGYTNADIAKELKAPRIEKKIPEVLSMKDVDLY